MVFDKWHAALQKAAVRWLTNSGFVDNWDIAEGDVGLHSCQLETDCVIQLSCQGRQQEITSRTERKKFINQEPIFVGQNWQREVGKKATYYTLFIHFN